MEEYGVVLNAKIDKFKSNMNKISNMMKDFSKEAKENFTTGVNLDVSEAEKEIKRLETYIEKTSKDIEFYQQKMAKGIDYSANLKKSNENLEKAKNELNALNKDLSTINTTPFGILGSTINNLKNTFIGIGTSIKSAFGKENLKTIEDYVNSVAKTELESKLLIQHLKGVKEEMEKSSGYKFKDDEEFLRVLKETNQEFKDMGKNSRSAGNGVSSMMTNGVKSLKRFALSLFGIQSIWRALSKATSTYMSQNKELQSKIQGVWNALGTLVGPIVEALANVFLKLVGYINVVTKALFNFDIIAKANANTLKKYREQMSKTVSGIDELTNINQNQNEGPQGLIKEEDLDLDPKIIKGLQDVSKWLKDNWDWLDKVLIAFGLVFGASAVAGWLNNIGKLLGVGGVAGGVGGTGLLGLASTLGWLAGMTALTIEIAIAYKYTKEWIDTSNNQEEATKQNTKLDKNIMNIIEDNKKMADSYKKGDVELNKYINSIETQIEQQAQTIRENQEWYDSLSPVEKVIESVTGNMYAHQKQTEEAGKEIDRLIDIYGQYYAQGKLTNKQVAYYNELLKYQNGEYRDSGVVLDSNASKYIYLTSQIQDTAKERQKDLDIIKQQDGAYGALGNAMDTLSYRNFDTLRGRIVNNKEALQVFGITVDDARRKLQDLTNGHWKASFTLEVYAQINAEALRRAVERVKQSSSSASGSVMGSMTNAFTEEVERLLRMLSGLGSYKIGTDLVKSDGLAYIHAGEQIVPAKAVSGGWTGGSNEETNDLLRTLIDTLEQKQFSASIGQDEVGRASVNYIRNQNRIMGGSVI